jgi:hypothetical protein
MNINIFIHYSTKENGICQYPDDKTGCFERLFWKLYCVSSGKGKASGNYLFFGDIPYTGCFAPQP